MQATHSAQYQKEKKKKRERERDRKKKKKEAKQNNQKLSRRTKQAFIQRRYTDG